MDRKYVSLSKKMSLALRHNPAKFGIELDGEGWTDLFLFLKAMGASYEDLDYILDHSDKQRFELNGGLIRAVYGHSVQDVQYASGIPPEILYHGTSPKVASVILDDGLKPMSRQYVHYSTDVATAKKVGGRRCSSPVILLVRAFEAHEAGHKFFHGNQDIWMSKELPSKFIERN